MKDLVLDLRGTIVCLQETKLGALTDQVVMETVGTAFASNFAYLSAQNTRGGVLIGDNIIAAHEDYYKVVHSVP